MMVDICHRCFTVAELLDIFNLSSVASGNGLSRDQFDALCPALLQQHLQGCAASDDVTSSSTNPSDLEMYGLGSLAVFIISISSLLGLLVVRWRDTPAYDYIICTMLGLSVGALVGDAVLHLGPQAMGLHDHSEDGGHSHGDEFVIEDYVWKMVVGLMAMWGFFMLQMGLEYANLKSGHGHSHNHSVPAANKVKHLENGIDNKAFRISSSEDVNSNVEKENHAKYHEHQVEDDVMREEESTAIKDRAVAWMVMVGDSVHNFADGLTIGASFAVDWRTGLATSIAVFCHELPHEFGDIAALLASGWSTKKVALVNFSSACVAFLGLFVGIPIATALDAQTWILATAMGMFLYVGLANIVPEMMETFKRRPSLKIALASNIGIFIGFLAMFLIAIFEDQIQF